MSVKSVRLKHRVQSNFTTTMELFAAIAAKDFFGDIAGVRPRPTNAREMGIANWTKAEKHVNLVGINDAYKSECHQKNC